MIEHDVLDVGARRGRTTTSTFSEVFDSQLPDHRYLDCELSWLAVPRVLELAEGPALPVLERANFLAIFASNLDEFFNWSA